MKQMPISRARRIYQQSQGIPAQTPGASVKEGVPEQLPNTEIQLANANLTVDDLAKNLRDAAQAFLNAVSKP